MGRLAAIKAILSVKRYLAVALVVAVFYLLLYFGQVSYTSGGFFLFFKNLALWYILISVPLAIIISSLIGISIALFAARLKEYRDFRASTSSFGGVLVGMLASGCPGCAIGLFPLVAGAFGISATLASLPLGGIELQLLSLSLLGTSIFFLSRPVGEG